MLASYYGQIITIIFQLTSVPLFIHYWGSDKYAEWLVVYTIPSIIGMMELGIFNIIINEVSTLSNREDDSGYTLSSTINTILIYVLIVMFLLIIYSSFLSYNNIYVVACCYSVCLLLNNFYNNLFKLTKEYHVGCFIANTVRLIEYSIILLIVYSNGSIKDVFISLLMIRLLSLIYVYFKYILKRNYCGLVTYKEFNFRKFVKLDDVYKNALLPLSLILNNQLLIILISHYFGNLNVILFSTLRTFFRMSNQITSGINNSLWQEFLSYKRLGDDNKLKSIQKNLVRFNVVLLSIIMIIYLIIGEYIYNLWTNGATNYSSYQYVVILVSVICYALWQPLYIYLNVLKKYSVYSYVYFFFQLSLCITIMFSTFDFFIGYLMFTEFTTMIILGYYIYGRNKC
ncbi:TPA: hypothetical protein ACX6SF_002818 [Photobacterium damselae]